MRPTISALAGAGVVLVISTLASCSSDKSEQSGTGGAPATGGVFGAGGTDFGVGGSPFMSLAGKDSGTCKKTDEPCDRTSDCCAGNLCNRNGPVAAMNGCKIACTQDSECPSGCCYKFIGANNGGMCADAMWCSCGGTAARCSSTLPKCCDTHVCLGGDPQASFYECRQKCTQNADCDTQCCVRIESLMLSACLDSSYCP